MTNGGVAGLVLCPAANITANPPTSSAAETAAVAIVFMTPRPSITDVGPDVDVIGHASQEARRFERIENDIRASRIEIPHALCLPLRQMQSWHLRVLRLNQTNPIINILSY
jgi:hypothetical protein